MFLCTPCIPAKCSPLPLWTKAGHGRGSVAEMGVLSTQRRGQESRLVNGELVESRMVLATAAVVLGRPVARGGVRGAGFSHLYDCYWNVLKLYRA